MRKRISLALILVTVVALAQTSQLALVLAADENVTLDIESSVPVINGVSLTNLSDSVVTTVDPEVTYKFKFTASHANTLDYLTDIVVDIYFGSLTTDDIRSCYTFTWTEGAGSTLFVSSPSGYDVSSVTPTAGEELLGSFNFELHFKLDGVAVPSGSSTTWHINVTATDDGSSSVSDATTQFDVTKFQDFTVSTSNIAFGTAIPGASLTKQQVTVDLTVNTQVNITVQGADLVNGSNSIPVDQFSAWDDSETTPAEHTLSTSATTVYSNYAATADTINSGVTGYTDGGTRILGFNGTVPSVQAVGSYSATWSILLDQSNVTPS